jgi:hypothetical protein
MMVLRGHRGRFVLGDLIAGLMVAAFLSACSQTSGEIQVISTPDSAEAQVGSCSLGLAGTVTDEGAIRALLSAEGDYVVRQDIESLMNLWLGDGRVCDANHTPAKLADDQTWQGRDAIRHRYVHRVFPGAPRLAEPLDLVVSIQGERAVVTGTTRIGGEISPGGDRWRLVKAGECWLIQELVFNLELQ